MQVATSQKASGQLDLSCIKSYRGVSYRLNCGPSFLHRSDEEEKSYMTMDINAGLAMKGTRIAVSQASDLVNSTAAG
jgi:hypothetical protein